MLNVSTIQGRLVADPVLRQTNSGIPVCSFTVAIDPDFKKQEKGATYVDCVAWRSTAEFVCRNFPKGRMILVVGSLQTRRWQDKNGANRKETELVVDQAYFCAERKPANNTEGAVNYAPQGSAPQAPQGYAPQGSMPQAPQGYAPQAPQAPQGYVPQTPQGYAPAPQQYQQPQQPQYQPQQPQYQQPAPAPAPAPAPQQAFAPGPGYVPQQGQPVPYAGEGEFTPLPDEDLPF